MVCKVGIAGKLPELGPIFQCTGWTGPPKFPKLQIQTKGSRGDGLNFPPGWKMWALVEEESDGVPGGGWLSKGHLDFSLGTKFISVYSKMWSGSQAHPATDRTDSFLRWPVRDPLDALATP